MKQVGASLLRTQRCNGSANLTSSVAASEGALMEKWGYKTGILHYSRTRRLFISSSSRGSNLRGSGKKPRVKLSTPSVGSPEATWCTSVTPPSLASRSKSLEMGRYGLKRLDYTTIEPPVWTPPPHPPTKTIAERVVFPLSIAVVAGIMLWVYMSPEEDDMTEYWKRVESGQILLYEDDYDDDDDDDDDDNEV